MIVFRIQYRRIKGVTKVLPKIKEAIIEGHLPAYRWKKGLPVFSLGTESRRP